MRSIYFRKCINYKKSERRSAFTRTYVNALYFKSVGKKTSVLKYDETIFLKLSNKNFIKVQTILLTITTNLTNLFVYNLSREPNSATGEDVYWALRAYLV
jgi:hypothetical protein